MRYKAYSDLVARTPARQAIKGDFFSRKRIDLKSPFPKIDRSFRVKRPDIQAPLTVPSIRSFLNKANPQPTNWGELNIQALKGNPDLTMSLIKRIAELCDQWSHNLLGLAQMQIGTTLPVIVFPRNIPLHSLYEQSPQAIVHFFILHLEQAYKTNFRHDSLFEIDIMVDSRFFAAAIMQLIEQFENIDVIAVGYNSVRFLTTSKDGITGEITLFSKNIYKDVIDSRLGVSARELLRQQDEHSKEILIAVSAHGDILLRQGYSAGATTYCGETVLAHTHPETKTYRPDIFPSHHQSSGDLAVASMQQSASLIVHEFGLTIYDAHTTVEYVDNRSDILNISILPSLDFNITANALSGTLMIVPENGTSLEFLSMDRTGYDNDSLSEKVRSLQLQKY